MVYNVLIKRLSIFLQTFAMYPHSLIYEMALREPSPLVRHCLIGSYAIFVGALYLVSHSVLLSLFLAIVVLELVFRMGLVFCVTIS
jgi:hypothetical protein